ncbi:MAG: hypothetical protein RSD53_07210 [Algoriella sp.]|uniref:hypothetical protein n=1 Tax=Chryseobacterium sp. TaxID=1871047 RepID=UPI002FCA1D24
MEKYCYLEEEIKESENKFCDGDIKKFGIMNQPIDETNMHVFIPVDDFTWREFPKVEINIPKLNFEKVVKNEKDFDFLTTNLSADGLLISEKAKLILEKFNLGNHQFYQFDLVIKKGNLLTKEIIGKYYWLHLVFDETKDNFIDFSKSLFKEKISFSGNLLEINELKYSSLQEWQNDNKIKHDRWLKNSKDENYHEIDPINLNLYEHVALPDIINFGRVSSGELFFSKKLIHEILKNDLKGINFYNTKLIIQ